MMDIPAFLEELKEAGIGVELQGEDLELSLYTEAPDARLIDLIRKHKEEIRESLRTSAGTTYMYAPIPKLPEAQSYPISYAQGRLWILSQFEDASVSYNIPGHIRLGGRHDADNFNRAINKVIERHEILRTVFRENEEGEVRQWVLKSSELDFKVQFFDWRDKPSNEEAVKEFISTDTFTRFDLEKGPLLRAALFQLRDDDFVFYYNMHHIISDGWSKEIMFREVFSFYEAYQRGGEPQMAPLHIQYRDYASWQLDQLQSDRLQPDRAYWTSKLSGELGVLDLPSTKKRPLFKTYNGHTIGTAIPGELAQRLKAYCQKHGGSLFMGLVASLKTLFYRYTGQQDIIVGSPIAGREHGDLENQIGFYVNTLALRDELKGTDSFDEVFAKVRQTCLEAYLHQMYPFDHLVEDLKVKRDTSRSVVFDILVLLQNNPGSSSAARQDADPEAITDLGKGTSKFDMLLAFNDLGDHLSFTIEYNPDVYDKALLEQMIRHYKSLLLSLLDQPRRQIRELGYLSVDEQEQLLSYYEPADLSYAGGRSIVDLFREQAEKAPERLAVLYGDRQLTYRQLDEISNQLAHYLKNSFSIQPDHLIGVMMKRSEWLIVSILGVLKSGAAYVPIDPAYPQERIRYMIDDAQIGLIMTDKDSVEVANRLQWESEYLQAFITVDTPDVYSYDEAVLDDQVNQELWDYVGEISVDEITSGGWISSFTGKPLSVAEMQEYESNVFNSIGHELNKNLKVLEIGCSSGLTLRKIAPHVGTYVGTDISPAILRRLRRKLDEGGYDNVILKNLSAFNIDSVGEAGFDIIIMNSVVQYFGKYNYFRGVLRKALDLLKDEGQIFVGDVMDLDLKQKMIRDLKQFKRENSGKGFKTKTDFSTELFLSRSFFRDLPAEFEEIAAVDIRKKTFTISNELTDYRYDVVLTKKPGTREGLTKKKQQIGLGSLDQYDKKSAPAVVHPRQLAYVIYTSGSTGKPKGVMVEHGNVVSFFDNFGPVFGLTPQMALGAVTNFTFDISVLELLGTLAHGMELVLLDAADMDATVDQIRQRKIQALQLTPSRLAQLAEHGGMDLLQNLDVLLIGGEALGEHLYAELKKFRSTRVLNVYGPTETTIWSSSLDIRSSTRLSIGFPLRQEHLLITDEYGQLVPVGVRGEICIGGPGVARGYLNQPELTEEKFIAHPYSEGARLYRTGDLGCWLEDGSIEFIGRKDSQVKIRGYRIELAEIEHVLLEHESIDEAVVIAWQGQGHEKELTAYIISKQPQNSSELRDYLRSHLPEYMIPAYFVQLQNLPLNSSGKVDKRALPDPKKHGLGGVALYQPATNDTQRKLVKIWEELLERTPIGILDDFFDLGGHSLKATRLLTKYQKQFEARLSLKDIFVHTTLSSHAALIANSMRIAEEPIERVPDAEYYPLSDAQRRMWVLSQFDGGSAAYNLPLSIRLNSALDLHHFNRAINKVIERHEILRTVFRENEEGEVRQWVLESGEIDFKVQFFDWRDKPANREAVKEFISADAFTKFDLENGPLLRAALFQLRDDDFVFYYNMHHIISDGWSLDVLSREINTIYAAYQRGEEPELAPLRIQYRDYASWQLDQLQSGKLLQDRAYWTSKLSGELGVLDLPSTKKRPLYKTYNGHTLETSIPGELALRLKAYCQKHGGSLFMGLLASLKTLFYRYTGQQDIILGSPIAGREHSDLENQIGFYVNTLALRDELKDTDSFDDVFAKVRQTCLEAYMHQMYPFDRLVEDLNIKRDTSRNAVFDILVVLQNNPGSSPSIKSDADGEAITDLGKSTSKFDLELSFLETEGALSLRVQYNTDVYQRKTIERLVVHFRSLLSSLLQYAGEPIGAAAYLSATEQEQLLSYEPAGFSHDGLSIVDLFTEQAQKTPGHVAVLYEDRQLTYRQLDEMSNQLAHYLTSSFGIQPDNLIGVMMNRSERFIVSILGVLKSGAAYVPIDPAYPQERIDYIRGDSQLAVLIDEQWLGDFLLKAEAYPSTPLPSKTQPGNLVYLIYTSGSTGKPKGIMMEQRSMLNLMHYHRAHIQASQVLQFASISFDVSFQEIFSTLLQGATLNVVSEEVKRDAEALAAFIAERNIDTLFLPTAYFKLLMEMEHFMAGIAPCVRQIIVAGEQLVLGDSFIRFFREKDLTLHNHYGPAETHVVTTYTIKASDLPVVRKVPPVGKPIWNTEILITDEYGNLVPEGVTGEICIGGQSLARGYLNQPKMTEKKFVPHPYREGERLYRTGDLGYLAEDGNFEYIGRKDNQVKVRGYRIELSEIEHVLLQHEWVDEAVVVVWQGENEKELAAYIVSKQPRDVWELRGYLRSIMPEFMVPGYFVQLEQLPLTTNGKVDRKALPNPVGVGTGTTSYAAPRNETEEKLVQIWQEILGRAKVGVKDNFFDLGGNSLKAIRLVSKMNVQFPGSRLRLGNLFQNTTIKKLADELSKASFTLHMEPSGLVRWTGQEKSETVLVLPGVGGVLDDYFELINALKEEYAVIAFDYTKLLSWRQSLDSITEMAGVIKDLLLDVRDAQKPMYILGHSFGGILGFELNKLLREDFQVERLVILDMPTKFAPVTKPAEVLTRDHERMLELKAGKQFPTEEDSSSILSDLAEVLRNAGPDDYDQVMDYYLFKSKAELWTKEHIVKGKVQNGIKVLYADQSFFDSKSMFDWQNFTADAGFVRLHAGHFDIVKGEHVPAIVKEVGAPLKGVAAASPARVSEAEEELAAKGM